MTQPAERVNAALARISDDDRGGAEGVDSQHLEVEEDGEEAGFPIGAKYTDNSISAWDGSERPDYQRLMRDVSHNLIGSVRATAADRLCRDVREGMDLIDLFNKHSVRLFTVARGEYNLKRAAGRADFISDVNSAAKESGVKSERVGLARKRQARAGAYGGGIRRYGWGVPTDRVRSVCVNPKADPAEREYVDVPVLDMTKHRADEAAEIRRWADELLAGVTMAHLLRDLRVRKVLTVSQKDGRVLKRGGKVVQTGGWDSKTVRRILMGPRVSGHAVLRGEIVKYDAWPAIISEEKRQALITLLDDPARVTTPGNVPKWLVSKIATCGYCVVGVVTARGGSRSKGITYRCNSCHKGNQLAELVDGYVARVAIKRLAGDDLADLIKPPRPDVDLNALRDELGVCAAKKVEAAASYARGGIDLAMLETIRADRDKRVREIRTTMSEATAGNPLADFVEADTEAAAQAVWASKSIGRRREIVRLLMSVTLLKGDAYKLDPETVVIGPPGERAAVPGDAA
ncbi:recombinase family protein [Streptomyces sp. MZ04]|uniref:recombinase family protein n=1 Tax=Streptomyces sp. MZ04 TaxID=2559236 RepID=UPI00107E6E79|nr:recombinase family protein [Streptomyces sp. MZ04]TGA89425.1 recombinase family protein [Streptomyces sp. MZ04]